MKCNEYLLHVRCDQTVLKQKIHELFTFKDEYTAKEIIEILHQPDQAVKKALRCIAQCKKVGKQRYHYSLKPGFKFQ